MSTTTMSKQNFMSDRLVGVSGAQAVAKPSKSGVKQMCIFFFTDLFPDLKLEHLNIRFLKKKTFFSISSQRPPGGPRTAPELPLTILDTTGKVGDVAGPWASLPGRPGPAAGPQLADGSGQDLRAPARPQGPIWGPPGGARRD